MGSLFGSSPKPPAPMNVAAVGQQQATQNTNNAYQQAAFNRVNQSDQFGNSTNYNQTGTDEHGNPIFGVSQQLGATGQQMAGGLGGLASSYFQNAGSRPDLGSDAAMNNAYNAATSFSAPRQEREQDAARNRMLNSGLDPNSEAYRNQMRDITENQSSANNTLAASLQNQMFNQGLANRSQQMGELQPGLSFASQTTQPGQINTPGVNVGNVDYVGLNSTAYNQQMDQYKAQMQQRNAMMGGLAGMAGTIGGAMLGGPIGASIGNKLFSTAAGGMDANGN